MIKKLFLFFILTCTTVCRATEKIPIRAKGTTHYFDVEKIQGYSRSYKIKSPKNKEADSTYKAINNIIWYNNKKFWNRESTWTAKIIPQTISHKKDFKQNGVNSYVRQLMYLIAEGVCELTNKDQENPNVFHGIDPYKPLTKNSAGKAGHAYPSVLDSALKSKNPLGLHFLANLYKENSYQEINYKIQDDASRYNTFMNTRDRWEVIFNKIPYIKIGISLIIVGGLLLIIAGILYHAYKLFTAPNIISERSYPNTWWAWLKTCRPLSWCGYKFEEPSRLEEIIVSPKLNDRIKKIIKGYKVAAKANTGMFNTVLYGPTGTGKTMIAKAIAVTLKEEGIEYIRVDGADPSKMDKTQISDTWQRVFDEASRKGPCIILVDEIEQLIGKHLDRDPANRSESLNTSKLLTLLQNTFHKKYAILATTNLDFRKKEDLKKIDEAFLNRFAKTRRIRVSEPSSYQRMQLFNQYLKKYGKEVGLTVSVDSEYTTGLEPYLKKLSTPRQIAGWTKEIIDEVRLSGNNEIVTEDVQNIIYEQEYLDEEEKRRREEERKRIEEEKGEEKEWYIE